MDMLKEYRRVAENFIEEMKKHPEVEGVMHLGGIARQRADEYSDIDIAVFSEKKLDWLKTGEQATPEGYDLEVFNVVMKSGSKNWDEITREAYQEGIIAYDKNGKVARFLKRALAYPEDYRVKKTAELVLAIAWHGWIYTPFHNKTAKNYRWLLTEELWNLRGEEKNVFYTAHYCLEKYMELLYVINRRWMPDYKWRYIRVKKLPWLPRDFASAFDELMFEEWSEKTWQHHKELFQRLLDEAVEQVIEYMPEDWYSLLE